MVRQLEPMVTIMDDSGDGFHEVNLELGGRIVATKVVNDDDSMQRMMRQFQLEIAEILARTAR